MSTSTVFTSERRDTILSLNSSVASLSSGQRKKKQQKSSSAKTAGHANNRSSSDCDSVLSSGGGGNHGDGGGSLRRKVQLLRRLMMPSDVEEPDEDVYAFKPTCGRKEKVYAVGSAVILVLAVVIACIVGSVHKVREKAGLPESESSCTRSHATKTYF